jgi:acyl-CoA synthetase (AMP-forming)/AMP-acid ligase II
MSKFTHLPELLRAQSAERIALRAPDRPPLVYGALRDVVAQTTTCLNQLGIGRGDRVTLVLPNGPEMACAFAALACATTVAPLNPGYRENEFEFYLTDLRAKALVVERGSTGPEVAVAERLGVQVLDLSPTAGGAGAFCLSPRDARPRKPTSQGGDALPDDIALMLHTSGTTSRPKLVPLTQRNVCASATNVRDTLALGPTDVGLNIMPLFHIHGLIAGLLAPLSAGSAIFCTPGFLYALKFFGWMREAKPTWYTAVPTMHQAIVSRAAANRAIIEANPLRFVRSSSAALPAQVIRALEAAFSAPVIEAYGMTEAAHQMASNPLHGKRIAGSVGVAAGPEVAIMDEGGQLLPPGCTGEIVIRGTNVMLGYENNPSANASAFHAGWFRTGDLGTMDDGGYLSITGRLKEIINRGGEKVSPREVDEVLLEHPAVAQALTFAFPDPKLGEEVAAAVVLREGQAVDGKELQTFAAQRLVDFKVPRKIVLLEKIPEGPTGKLQRIGLAAKLGLA